MIYFPEGVGNASAASPSPKKAEAKLRSMQNELRDWLRYRTKRDVWAASQPNSAAVMQRVREGRFSREQDLANTLYELLKQVFGSSSLPSPDMAGDPSAAVKLAQVVLSGGPPSAQTGGPQAQGIVWFAIAIPVAGVVLVLGQLIKSKAEVAKEQERIQCCKETGSSDCCGNFWLKAAAVFGVGWFAWEKLGVKRMVTKK